MMQLKNMTLERIWPVLNAEVLAYTELKDDELYPHIRPNQILSYIEGAMEFGRQSGIKYEYSGDLAPLMAHIVESGARVTFIDQKKHEGEKLVRAQYERKPANILVYRPSLEQMDHFFLKSGFRIRQEDFMALHMCHEWFHHLEETRLGRTDQQLPKLVMRKVGPVMFKQSVESTREIAAHAFTQQVMGLSWYPLLLDMLISQSERKVKKEQIRESFNSLKHEFERAVEREKTAI